MPLLDWLPFFNMQYAFLISMLFFKPVLFWHIFSHSLYLVQCCFCMRIIWETLKIHVPTPCCQRFWFIWCAIGLLQWFWLLWRTTSVSFSKILFRRLSWCVICSFKFCKSDLWFQSSVFIVPCLISTAVFIKKTVTWGSFVHSFRNIYLMLFYGRY